MKVKIGDIEIEAEVADDEQSRYIGLSDTHTLAPNEGMLFVWPTEKEHRLVMRDMSMRIDMILARSDGTITEIKQAQLNQDSAQAISKFGLEVPYGFCEKHGIQPGDKMQFKNDAKMEKTLTSAGPVGWGPAEREEVDNPVSNVENPEDLPDLAHPESTENGGTITYSQGVAKERHYVDNVHEAPEDATVHVEETDDDEKRLYYEKDLPDECRSCGSNERMEGSMVCEDCADAEKQDSDGEFLEIKDYYRVWLKEAESAPEGVSVHAGSGPGEAEYYYEVPFDSSTVIDLSDTTLERAVTMWELEKDDPEFPSEEDMKSANLPHYDREFLREVESSVNENTALQKAKFSQAPEMLSCIASPLTLLYAYKRLTKAPRQYHHQLNHIKRALEERNIEAIDKLEKKRRYVDSPEEAPEWADVQQGPEGGYYYDTEDEESDEEEGLPDFDDFHPEDDSGDEEDDEEDPQEEVDDILDDLFGDDGSLDMPGEDEGETPEFESTTDNAVRWNQVSPDEIDGGEQVRIQTDDGEVISGEASIPDMLDGIEVDGEMVYTADMESVEVGQELPRPADVAEPGSEPLDEEQVQQTIEESVPYFDRDEYYQEDWAEEAKEPIKDLIAQGARGRDIVEALREKRSGGTTKKIFSKVISDFGISRSETIDSEVPFTYDRNVENRLQKSIAKEFSERYPEAREHLGAIDRAVSSWSGSSTNKDAAELWVAASKYYSDVKIPEEVQIQIDEGNYDKEAADAIMKYQEVASDVLRDTYGEEFTIYRGVGGSTGRDLKRQLEQAEEGDRESIDYSPRAIGSWSNNPMIAESFARGATVVERTFSPEDILASHLMNAGFPEENELIPLQQDQVDLPPEQVHKASGRDSTEKFADMAAEHARRLANK